MGPGEHFVDVGKVHFEAVLVFVYVLGHELEVAGLMELGSRGGVDIQVTQWSSVVRALRQSGFLEVVVV